VLLDAADHTSSPWLGPWTVLAAATGARNGELCGLEWADLDLGRVSKVGGSREMLPAWDEGT
jgi:integrase